MRELSLRRAPSSKLFRAPKKTSCQGCYVLRRLCTEIPVFNPHSVQLQRQPTQEQRSSACDRHCSSMSLRSALLSCQHCRPLKPNQNTSLHVPENITVGEMNLDPDRLTDKPPKMQTVGIPLPLPWCAPARSSPCRIRRRTEILTSSMLRSFSSRVDTCHNGYTRDTMLPLGTQSRLLCQILDAQWHLA